jgi:DNA repair protein SbcD/Mre11
MDKPESFSNEIAMINYKKRRTEGMEMKIFHTADWHLGKLVQGVYMTEDQRYILQQFLAAVDEEQPDVVIIAGDLYDRSLPPVDAVHLLDEVLEELIIKRKTPVIAIAGNHDSPTRLDFGSKLMKNSGLHIVGEFSQHMEPIIINDAYGEVHFHLIPFAEPSIVRTAYNDESVLTYDDAMKKITDDIVSRMSPDARHIAIAHAFVTPTGEKEENTSDSERPLAIGGSECVSAQYFLPFHYTALGHLHKAHKVLDEKICYAGSPLKYSASEALHEKGFYSVELHADGQITKEKRKLTPIRDMRIVEGTLQDILRHEENEDYVFITLTDLTPVVGAMEQIRTVYKNAMHVTRKTIRTTSTEHAAVVERAKLGDKELFEAFCNEMNGNPPSEMVVSIFEEVLQELLKEDREQVEVIVK